MLVLVISIDSFIHMISNCDVYDKGFLHCPTFTIWLRSGATIARIVLFGFIRVSRSSCLVSPTFRSVAKRFAHHLRDLRVAEDIPEFIHHDGSGAHSLDSGKFLPNPFRTFPKVTGIKTDEWHPGHPGSFIASIHNAVRQHLHLLHGPVGREEPRDGHAAPIYIEASAVERIVCEFRIGVAQQGHPGILLPDIGSEIIVEEYELILEECAFLG
jgi:hypothetical protein